MYTSRRILFALLHCGLHPDNRGMMESFAPLFGTDAPVPDWKTIYKLAAKQGVLAIAWDGLLRLCDEGIVDAEHKPDKGLELQWAYNVCAIESRYRKQRRAVFRLAEFYAGHNIDMMILKGYGLSLCYPVPEHRPCGDIDIWLFGRQQEGDDLLRREKGVKINEDKHHHTIFVTDGIMVENHYDFINVYAHMSNHKFEEILQSKVRSGETESIEEGGVKVVLPPVDFNALFLLRHTAGHFAATGIGLRHIVDWAVFVGRYGEQIDWPWLREVAREYNMHIFLNSLNAMAVECTGADASLLAEDDDKELTARILDDIISSEFGEPERNKGALLKYVLKLRRWWANRWKRRIVYREGLVNTFIVQLYAYMRKPNLHKRERKS